MPWNTLPCQLLEVVPTHFPWFVRVLPQPLTAIPCPYLPACTVSHTSPWACLWFDSEEWGSTISAFSDSCSLIPPDLLMCPSYLLRRVWRERSVSSCLRMIIPALHPVLHLSMFPALSFPYLVHCHHQHPSPQVRIPYSFRTPLMTLCNYQVLLIPPNCLPALSPNRCWALPHLCSPRSPHAFPYPPGTYSMQLLLWFHLFCFFP